LNGLYWAGALPGLILGTFLSVGVARSLPRTGSAMAHVLWLVPGLHFAGAFLLGPAASLLYGLAIVPALGGLAPWAWLAGMALIAGGLIWRVRGAGSTWRPLLRAAALGIVLCLGCLVPLAYGWAGG
jgi:hypothetical protein